MKKVSFLVPAFNHASYVKATLDSIWLDDYPNKEIVIVNDGSSDNTADIIKKWGEEKKWQGIVYRERENRGITRTLNELIEISTGEFIRIFSSDDLLKYGSTQKMVRILESDSSAAAIFGDADVIDGNDVVIHTSMLEMNGANKRRLSNEKCLPQEIVSNWAVSGPVLLIRKEYYKKLGMYDENLLVDDWDMYLRLLCTGGLRYIDDYVASYRIHGGNVSRTRLREKRIKNLQSQASVVDKNIDLFEGRMRSLFLAEKYLLFAKIAYLSHHFISCGWNLCIYILFKLGVAK